MSLRSTVVCGLGRVVLRTTASTARALGSRLATLPRAARTCRTAASSRGVCTTAHRGVWVTETNTSRAMIPSRARGVHSAAGAASAGAHVATGTRAAEAPAAAAAESKVADNAVTGESGSGSGDAVPRKWRFGVLWNEDLEKWKGFYNAYKVALGNDATDEPWRVYRATKGEYPTDEEIASMDGFVMSGSHYSVYEDLPWIQKNMEFIRKAHALAQSRESRRPKLVGICFGCQAAAQALGGRVDVNGDGDFTLTCEDLTVTDAAMCKPYAAALVEAKATGGAEDADSAEDALRLLESHGDRVHELPEGAQVIATSPSAPLEMWELDDTVLSVQGHPEFDHEVLIRNIFPTISERRGWSEEEAAARMRGIERPHSHEPICKALRAFLTDGREWPAPDEKAEA